MQNILRLNEKRGDVYKPQGVALGWYVPGTLALSAVASSKVHDRL